MDKFDHLTNFNDFLEEQMKQPDFKAEYDALEPEFSITKTIIEARIQAGLTQRQLSEKTGISQADISRLEHGTANPSLKTLQRIATALNRKIQIEFV